jgi:nucleoside-diphosphate-sugar epimerase
MIMATLVTGATGRIGSRFVPRLLDRDDDVRVLVRDPRRAAVLEERGARVILGDVTDDQAVSRAVGDAQAIVHLAAAFRGVDAGVAHAVNHRGTLALARAALAAGAERFVLASTNLVYGPGRGRPAREDDLLAPEGAYPQSKATAEAELRSLHDAEGLGLRIVRLAFVYGEGDPHLRESLMWANNWPLHKRLHLVHHADVGQALVRALHADGVDGETFNVADDAPVTAYELLDLNRQPAARDAAERPLDDPWEGIIDTAKSRRVLGLRPLYPSVHAARDAGAL